MLEVRDLKTDINALFNLCDEANRSFRSVDAYTQHKYMQKIVKQSTYVFQDLENRVNNMGKKDLIRDIQDRETLLKLYFVLLKSLYMFSKMGVTRFEDMRCQGATMLAYKMIQDLDYGHKFGSENLWLNNDYLYINGLMQALKSFHPKNMQTLIRCITATLVYPDVKNQKVYDYMEKFEKYIIYYLMQCKPEERIYLDFVR